MDRFRGGGHRHRRHGPARRAHAGHRRVAARAGVALGSVGYYFGGRDDLLVAAVEALAEPWLHSARAVAADPPDDLADALVRLVAGDAERDELRVEYERLVQAARMPALAALTSAWTDELVELTSKVLSSAGHTTLTPRAAVAVVDGLILHHLADTGHDPKTAARDELPQCPDLSAASGPGVGRRPSIAGNTAIYL